MLPPGCARLSTKPPPTGSETCKNMIGRLRATLRTASEAGVGCARVRSGPRCGRFFCVSAHKLNITAPKAIIDSDISSDGPSAHLQPLAQCLRTSLRFSVVRCPHQHENLPHPLRRLLRARRSNLTELPLGNGEEGRFAFVRTVSAVGHELPTVGELDVATASSTP